MNVFVGCIDVKEVVILVVLEGFWVWCVVVVGGEGGVWLGGLDLGGWVGIGVGGGLGWGCVGVFVGGVWWLVGGVGGWLYVGFLG
uniref:Uncharacterized protein n=1 Tax=Knipowitschia caucasica TaxID=637954 RepID=A0AAV2JWR2_KNICA